MHGLIIQSSYSDTSGINYSILTKNQIESLEKIGVKIDLFLINNIKNPIKYFKSIGEIREKINDSKYDFIHFHYGGALGFMGIFLNHQNKIISICGSDILIHGKNTKSVLTSILTKISVRFYKKIIVKSENLRNSIPKSQQNRTYIIPNGVDTIKFFEKKLTKKKTFDILFHEGSKNKKIKNFELAKKTIELLKIKIPNLKFKVISDLPHYKLPKLLQHSDCLLVTSFHEGSPNIVKESLAVNTPIVSVDCGDVKQRLKNTNLGGVSKKYDEVELCDLIYGIYTSKKKYNGRDIFYEQKLDSNSIARKLKEIYLNKL